MGKVLFSLLVLASCINLTAAHETYALDVGESGAKRLDIQSAYFHRESCAHLEKAGLREGQIVYDIGCGTGFMTHHMASIVGPQGHVYGIDSSPAQLELAEKRILDSTCDNVTFIQENVQSDNLPCPQKADLIYCRFLLMHLNNPADALSAMMKLLKPGGQIVLQECITSTCHLSDHDPQLNDLFNALINLGQKLGLDYDIGLSLKALAESEGLKDITQDEHQYELQPDFARYFLTFTHQEWVKKALHQGIITEEKYVTLGERIKYLNRSFFISKQIYITGNI